MLLKDKKDTLHEISIFKEQHDRLTAIEDSIFMKYYKDDIFWKCSESIYYFYWRLHAKFNSKIADVFYYISYPLAFMADWLHYGLQYYLSYKQNKELTKERLKIYDELTDPLPRIHR